MKRMKRSFRAAVGALLSVSLAVAANASGAVAQEKSSYFSLGPARAVYATPAEPTKVAFLVIHRTADFTTHVACQELPKRGIAALCMSTRFTNNEFMVDWDRIALDVKAGVEFLRKQPGIEKVVLFGHSGGGPTTSFYQAVAENGLGFCKDPQKLVPCRDDLAGLPKADGLILADAHPGVPVILLRSLNGSVIDETPGRFDPTLDPYSPANGYNANGSSSYSDAFQKRYFAAQSARMNALIDSAQARFRVIRDGKGPYPDNDLFIIPHGGNPGAGPGGASQLHSLDTAIALRRTREPQKLLRNDGTIARQIVNSVSPPELETKESTNSFNRGTKILSLQSFLSTQAVRSTNSLDGIDHCSSNNSTICAVRSIRVPLLVIGMGGYLFIRDSEEEYENAASSDKDLVFIEGATHGFGPCRACASDPNAYVNSLRNMFDYVKTWVNTHMQ
jgi:pimeloyl-ACP methyl ester carboxylesterase